VSAQHQNPHKKPPPSNSTPAGSKESLLMPNSTPPKQHVSSKQKLENELKSVFNKVDTNHSGKISSKELSLALLNFDHTRFQDSTISLMIKLFSGSNSSSSGSLKSLTFEQFVSLWKYLSAYKKLFIAADSNKSGDISFGEFQKVLEQIGYKLNIDLVLHLFQKFAQKASDDGYDDGSVGKLKFDAFIELLVYLRKLTDIFKKYDKDLSGVATINFLDFLFEVSNLS
jgi:Ca2+-binding EF-hand superfamily protein